MEWLNIPLFILGSGLLIAAFYLFFIKHDKGPRDVEGQVGSIKDHFSVNQGWLSSWFQRFKNKYLNETAQSNQETQGTLMQQNQMDAALLASTEILEQAPVVLERDRKKSEAVYIRDMAMVENEQQVIDRATRDGLHAPTYLATEHQRQMDQLAINLEWGIVETRIYEAMERKRIELAARWNEIEQDLDGLSLYQRRGYIALQEHQQYIFQLYDERKLLQGSTVPMKKRKLDFLDEHIGFMEEDFRERQRLLQSRNREDHQTSYQDTDD